MRNYRIVTDPSTREPALREHARETHLILEQKDSLVYEIVHLGHVSATSLHFITMMKKYVQRWLVVGRFMRLP